MRTILVTRHAALKDFFEAKGLRFDTSISHASIEDVMGAHVYGVLPLHLAAHAAKVTEVSLSVPAEKRGQELTLEEVKTYYRGIVTYKVEKIEEFVTLGEK